MGWDKKKLWMCKNKRKMQVRNFLRFEPFSQFNWFFLFEILYELIISVKPKDDKTGSNENIIQELASVKNSCSSKTNASQHKNLCSTFWENVNSWVVSKADWVQIGVLSARLTRVLSFRSVVVITLASHARGPEFEPQRKQSLLFCLFFIEYRGI